MTSNTANIPQWSFSTSDDSWDPINQTLAQCSQVTIAQHHDVHSRKPATMEIWIPGRVPHRVPLSGHGWEVNLPVGGPYMALMYDSNGIQTGGGTLFTVLPSSNTCTQANLHSTTLDLVILPEPSASLARCSTVPISVRGGKPPYKLTVLPISINGRTSNPPKSIESSGEFEYVVDASIGTNVFFGVQDTMGLGATGPMYTVVPDGEYDNQDVVSASCSHLKRRHEPRSPQAAASAGSGISTTGTSTTPSATVNRGSATTSQVVPSNPTASASAAPLTTLQWWTGHLWIIASAIVGTALLVVLIYMIVRCCIFARAKRKDKERYLQELKDSEETLDPQNDSTTSLTTAGPNGKPMTGAWVGTPRGQRLPPPGGFTPSPGGGFGQTPRRRVNATPPSAGGGTPLTDTPTRQHRRTPSRAGQKGKYSIITSLDDDPDEEEEYEEAQRLEGGNGVSRRPTLGRTNSLYSSEYMREMRKNAGPVPTSYNVVPNPDTEQLPSTYFAVASGRARSVPRRVEKEEGAQEGDGTPVEPGSREFNYAYAQAKFPKMPTTYGLASKSTLALAGGEDDTPGFSTNTSTATLVQNGNNDQDGDSSTDHSQPLQAHARNAPEQPQHGGNPPLEQPQARAKSWVSFLMPDWERSRSSSPRYPPGLEPRTEEEEVEADIAYEGIEYDDEGEEEGQGLLDSLKAAEQQEMDEDSSLPYRSSKARDRYGGPSSQRQEGLATPKKRSTPLHNGTPSITPTGRRPLPPTPTQALVSPMPLPVWPGAPKKDDIEDEDEVQWGKTIRLLNSAGSLRSNTTADSDEQIVQTGRAI